MEQIFTSDDPVVSVEFVPNDWSCDTLAIVTDCQVVLCQLVAEPVMTCTVMKRYILPCRPLHFNWSPDTCTESVPQVIKFAVCSFDKTLTVTLDSGESCGPVRTTLLESDYFLNEAAFNPHRPSELAVIGDDCRCHFIDTEGQNTRPPLILSAPGRRMAWRRDRADLLLICVETGSIGLFNAASGQILQVFDVGKQTGILDSDWLVAGPSAGWTAALLPGQLVLADMEAPSATKIAFPTPCDSPAATPICCRWCPSNRGLLAVSCAATPTAVLQQKMATFITADEEASGCRSITWHQHRSLLAMARHYSVFLWSVDAV